MLTATLRCGGHRGRLLQRLLDHVHGQWADETGRLRELDELFRLEEAALWRAPAGESLKPDQVAAVEVDQRLEEGHELAIADAGAHLFLERHPIGELVIQLLVEPGEPIAPVAFGGKQGDVALAEHVFLLRQLGDGGDADGCGCLHLRPAAKIGVASRAMIDPAISSAFLGDSPTSKNPEFVPASAGTAGRLRCGFLQDLGHAPQQLIAREVAVQVIDPLEMVEIDEEQRSRLLGIKGVTDRAQQFPAVRQPRRGVDACVALGEPLRLLIGIERVLQVLGAAPAEQDDRNIEEERHRQAGVRHAGASERGAEHLAAQPNEKDEGGNRRTADDQLAAGNPDRLIRHASRPHVWQTHH